MSAHWFKSSFSGTEKTCVEISHRRDAVLIRDSKYTGPAEAQPVLTVAPANWSALLGLALNQESGAVADLTISVDQDGGATVTAGEAALAFNAAEWIAFGKGVAAGEFDRP